MSLMFALAMVISSLTAPTEPVPAQDRAIVVQGSRDPRKPANEYMDKVLPLTMDAEFGRFENPVCPGTVGLPDNLRSEVLTRIRTVAAAARIDVAGAQCTPNLMIIVVDDKKKLIEGMRREKPVYLTGLRPDQLKRLVIATGPVAAWQIGNRIGADGMPLRYIRIRLPDGTTTGDTVASVNTTVPPGRTRHNTRVNLVGAVIVVEQRGLLDVTTRQLADFALVRALTPISSRSREAPSSSVLSLFSAGVSPQDAPQTLTWWDLAFLKALADVRSDSVASIQRHEIRDRMLKEMAKVPVGER
jgi:hypothetical protein